MSSYLTSILKLFRYYKSLGDKTITQLSFEELLQLPDEHSNSISILISHISGNMLSRWTNFLIEDGEKPWRHRDQEFEDTFTSKELLLEAWENGWSCLFTAMEDLNEDDLEGIIYIRNQGHTVTESINRQLAHYSYHIGQIVLLGKMIKGSDWQSLSIPKGASNKYNQDKFAQDKIRKHFTEDL